MKNKTTFILIIALLLFSFLVEAQNPVDFELTSVTDSSHFILSKAKGEFVALHFLLKTECPYCLRHTHDYVIKSTALPNVLQIFIKPDTEKEIAEWAGKLLDNESIKHPIYRDPEAKLAKCYNIPNGYSFHGQIVHYPALILLDTEGNEVFRYIGKNNSDRFSFEQLVDKITELTEIKSK